jgi:hypothetical protein
MKPTPTFARSLKVALITGAVVYVVTFIIPLIFYFGLVPISGDAIETITVSLWTPLKLLVDSLSHLLSHDLWQIVNPIYAAPFVDALVGALLGFGVCYWFLRSRSGKDSDAA